MYPPSPPTYLMMTDVYNDARGCGVIIHFNMCGVHAGLVWQKHLQSYIHEWLNMIYAYMFETISFYSTNVHLLYMYTLKQVLRIKDILEQQRLWTSFGPESEHAFSSLSAPWGLNMF